MAICQFVKKRKGKEEEKEKENRKGKRTTKKWACGRAQPNKTPGW